MNADEMLEMFEAMNPCELSNLIESAMWNLESRKGYSFSTATQEECGKALTELADEFIHHASCMSGSSSIVYTNLDLTTLSCESVSFTLTSYVPAFVIGSSTEASVVSDGGFDP